MEPIPDASRPRKQATKSRVEFTLALLRAAATRARLCATDIDFVGVSLQHGMISPDQAIEMLHNAGGADLVLTTPGPQPGGGA